MASPAAARPVPAPIDAVLAADRRALVLIPENRPDAAARQHFRKRFPRRSIVTLHSGLAEVARADNWLAAPEADVLLGTRLSVFAPQPRLGLIVVDEEHDGSFKQQDGLRYSARDVAIARGQQAGVPVVLGSATPSLESYAQALAGRYQLIELRQRAVSQAQLPAIEAGRPQAYSARQRPHPPRAQGAHRNAWPRRAEPGVPQPPRLRPGAVLPELRLGVAVPELLGAAGAAPHLASIEVPSLRIRDAYPGRMSELRQPRPQAARPGHAAA
jgi:hypothetical protein